MAAFKIKKRLSFIFQAIPILTAMICILLLSFICYDYFDGRSPPKFFARHWAGCGDFDAIRNAGRDTDYLALEIKESGLGQFVLTGQLFLTAHTARALEKLAPKEIVVDLANLRSPYAFASSGQSFSLDLQNKAPQYDGNVAIRVVPGKIYTDASSLEYFPFDQYKIGYRPIVRYYTTDGSNKVLNVSTAVTNVRLSPLFTVRKVAEWGDYVTGVRLEEQEKTRQYLPDECTLLLKRSPWYIEMVALLLLLLFVPAIYLSYRPEDNPGIDLIAVILGIAAIRQFFLGSVDEWNLYLIDIVFAGIAVITAIIPLFRLNKRASRHEYNDID
jgi:hypothetical protein